MTAEPTEQEMSDEEIVLKLFLNCTGILFLQDHTVAYSITTVI